MTEMSVDVLVAGGGTAGVIAALAAAEEGCNVLIVEPDTALGGVGTRGGVHGYYYGIQGGMLCRMVDKAVERRGQVFGGDPTGFHPEAKRTVLAEMIRQLGVRVLFGAVITQVLLEGNHVVGAVAETDRETVYIHAKVTIDSTGNGDIAFLAGVPCKCGREWDGVYHTYSLVPRYLNQGKLSFRNFDAGWVDSTDVWDVTRAYVEGRRHLWKTGNIDHYITIASQLGIREGRYIQGDYVLQLQDLILDRRFDDVVMRCFSHYDNHAWDYANESEIGQIWVCILGLWQQALGGDIPYRCFLPSGVEGLLIGCRALSMDRDAGMALRMQRDIQNIGEVAGVAAAMAVRRGVTPRELNVYQLQERLIARGVISPNDLSRVACPWVTPGGAKREDGRWTLERLHSPECIEELVDYLGTDDEGKALYWLWMAGESAVARLRQELVSTEYRRRRAAALGLALIGYDDGVDVLLQSIEQRDSDSLPGYRVPPRWVASFLALKVLHHPGAVPQALDILKKDSKAEYLLFALHYLAAVEGRCTAEQREEIADAIESLVNDRPNLGEDYTLQGGIGASLRWSIEIAAGYLLVLYGRVDGHKLIEKYLGDHRGYARGAARRMIERIRRGSTYDLQGNGEYSSLDEELK